MINALLRASDVLLDLVYRTSRHYDLLHKADRDLFDNVQSSTVYITCWPVRTSNTHRDHDQSYKMPQYNTSTHKKSFIDTAFPPVRR